MPPQPLPVTRVIHQAELQPLQALPPLTHQSYPVPVRGGRGGLQLLFFYGHAEIVEPRDGLKLWPPAYVACLNPFTGKFEELKAVAAGDFGQRPPPDKPFGKYLTVAERMQAAFVTKLALWQQAFDDILPGFAANSFGLTPAQQQSARDFARLSPDILEPPLVPYYHTAAREFFDWLRMVTPPRP